MRRTHRRAAALIIGTINTLAAVTGCAHTTADDTPATATDQTNATSTPATPSPTIGRPPTAHPSPEASPTGLLASPTLAPSTAPTSRRRDPRLRGHGRHLGHHGRQDQRLRHPTSGDLPDRRARAKRPTTIDPDTAKGQAQFTQAAQHDSYTTVTIREIVEEGLDPDQDGDVHRIVHYLRQDHASRRRCAPDARGLGRMGHRDPRERPVGDHSHADPGPP